jgi:tetratricopeptide (TPR) repeat protein
MSRFPTESRFPLIRAFALDYRLRQAVDSVGAGERLRARPAAQLDDLLARYDDALRHPDVATEAAVRKAWLLHRLLRHDEALALLNAAGDDPSDAAITYYRHLIRGRVLDTLGRLDDAVAAYRQALDLVPDAQSASIGLMTGLLRLGQHDEAEALADRVQASQDADPWPDYWAGDYRYYPGIIARLREGSR